MSDMKTEGLFRTACELREEQLKPVVECGGHGWQPYAIVCTHLLEDNSTEWHRVELAEDDCREVDCDWLCPTCLAKYETDDVSIVDELLPMCMDCMRTVRPLHQATSRDGTRTYEILVLDRTEHRDGQARKGEGGMLHFTKADVSWLCDCCEPSDEFMQGVRMATHVADGNKLVIDQDVVTKHGFQTVLGTHRVKDEDGSVTTIRYLIGQRRR